MSRSKKKRNSLAATYAALVFMASFIVVPVLWMISTAFKTEPQTYYPQPKWIPDPFSLDSFRKFWTYDLKQSGGMPFRHGDLRGLCLSGRIWGDKIPV